MRMTRRWILVTCAALAVFAVLPPSAWATGSSARALLSRYQPVTVLDPMEAFTPTAVGSFVADANLETQTAPNTWAVVDAHPSAGRLPTTPTAACVSQTLVPCYRLNQRDCTPAGGLASVACYRTAWLAPPPRSVLYGRATTAGRSTVLQYWYFYYDDFYSYNYPPDDFIWQSHEGDWEAVTILVPRGSSHPSWVGYSQHCTGQRRRWADVPRWRRTSHPVVDVAIGSHANYFTPGEHQIATQCIPPQAIAFLQQNGLALPNDHVHPGPAYGPTSARGVSATSIVHVTGRSPEWMRFIGTWGEYQYFHGPSPINTVPSGFSPSTPTQMSLWQHPVGTVFSWPTG